MLGALGLAAACGLNAWLSLLLTGLFLQAGWVHVAPHWSAIGNVGVVLIAAAFFLVDFAIDKLSEVRRGLRGGVFVSAAMGTILFDAHAGTHVSWVAALVLGGGTAALLHGARAFARPAVAAEGPAAVGSPAVRRLDRAVPGLRGATMSLLEDVAAALLVIVAFSAPAIAGAVSLALLGGGLLMASYHGRPRTSASTEADGRHTGN